MQFDLTSVGETDLGLSLASIEVVSKRVDESLRSCVRHSRRRGDGTKVVQFGFTSETTLGHSLGAHPILNDVGTHFASSPVELAMAVADDPVALVVGCVATSVTDPTLVVSQRVDGSRDDVSGGRLLGCNLSTLQHRVGAPEVVGLGTVEGTTALGHLLCALPVQLELAITVAEDEIAVGVESVATTVTAPTCQVAVMNATVTRCRSHLVRFLSACVALKATCWAVALRFGVPHIRTLFA